MKSSIISNLTEEEKAELTAEFRSSARLRRRLIKMLESQVDAYYDAMLTEPVGNNPSWALVQAEKIAEIKATKKLISLLQN